MILDTYKFGPLSDENSQWNTNMCRLGLSSSTRATSDLDSTSSDKICSLV